MTSRDQDERLRREASEWFARMRGPGAEAHREAFEAWRASDANGRAYQRLVQRFDESAILGHSRLSDLRLTRGRSARGGAAATKIGLALAACLIATLTAAAFAWRGETSETLFSTEVGQIRTIALADGVSMILDTDSVAAASSRRGRQLVRLERGRARFVTGGSELAVKAGQAEVTAKDATFDLALAPQDQIDVTVLSGRPRLSARGGKLQAANTPALMAGRQVRLGSDLTTRRVVPASTVESGWPSGLRRFDQASLAQVAEVANRYNTRKIRFADPTLGGLRVTGVFRITGSENLAQALAAAFGLTVGQAPGGDIVLSRAAA
jgi:transmembrane sensor